MIDRPPSSPEGRYRFGDLVFGFHVRVNRIRDLGTFSSNQ